MGKKIFCTPPILKNEKVILEPLQQSHSTALYKQNHPDIWSFMLSKIDSLEEMVNWVAAAIHLREKQIAFPFVVKLKEDNRIIGTTRLSDIDFDHKSCELGSTWYGKHYQRSFVNTNCKYLILQYCFEELNFVRVQFKTDERNITSQKAIERLGAIKEGVLRNEKILQNGYIRNSVIYSITNSDWISIKPELKNKASMKTTKA